jgi:metallo-beta-lactamase family protein
MDMKLTFLGGAENVTGSSHLLDANGLRILVDCGFYQERALQYRNWMPFAVEPSSIDAVVLTHAHLDHCGLLPKLVKDGFEGPIYATEASVDIAEIVMRDAAKIQAEDAAYKKRRHEREGRESKYGYEPLFTPEDVERVLPLFERVRYGKTQKIGTGIDVTLNDAGHILGSASVLIAVTRHGNTRRVLFSGDLGRPGTPILRDSVQTDEQADYVCVESTYGNRVHKTSGSIAGTLTRVVNAAVKAGGNIVIPSFAIERTQELLYRLGGLRAENKIPEVPVFVDSPMAVKVTEVFKRHPELFDAETMERLHNGEHPCDFKGLQLTRSVEQSKAINKRSGTSIIIAGSGMCTGGRIKHHLANNIERPESTILFVGYQAEGTLGRQLLEGAHRVRLFGQMYDVHARLEKVNGMSAHADRNELLDWLRALNTPPTEVFVIHGEKRASAAFSESIQHELGWSSSVATYQREVTLG